MFPNVQKGLCEVKLFTAAAGQVRCDYCHVRVAQEFFIKVEQTNHVLQLSIGSIFQESRSQLVKSTACCLMQRCISAMNISKTL